MFSPCRAHLLPPPVHTRDGHVMEAYLLHLPSVGQSGRHHAAILGLSFFYYFLPGTQIYCLNGTDPEGQLVRYGLSFDPGSKEYFRVEPISGNVTLVEQLDREVNCPSSWWNNSISSSLTNAIFEFYMNLFEIPISETRFD